MIVAQLLLFQQVAAEPKVQQRAEGLTENLTLVLAELGCLGCAFPDCLNRVVRITQKGMSHAAAVSQVKAFDPDHVFKEQIAAPDPPAGPDQTESDVARP